jgi:hypothetical protein
LRDFVAPGGGFATRTPAAGVVLAAWLRGRCAGFFGRYASLWSACFATGMCRPQWALRAQRYVRDDKLHGCGERAGAPPSLLGARPRCWSALAAGHPPSVPVRSRCWAPASGAAPLPVPSRLCGRPSPLLLDTRAGAVSPLRPSVAFMRILLLSSLLPGCGGDSERAGSYGP